MKKSVLCSLVATSLFVAPVGSVYAASSITTTKSGSTSTTSMPGGVQSTCKFNASGGLKDAKLNIPDSVINNAMGAVGDLLGAFTSLSQIKKRLKKIINKKASEFCSRVTRLSGDDSGEAALAESEMDSIYSDNSAYTMQIQSLEAEIETLAASLNATNAESVLGQINAKTEQQISVMEAMETDMNNEADQHADDREFTAGTAPSVDDSGVVIEGDDEAAMCDVIYSPPATLPPAPDPDTATEEELAAYEEDVIEYDNLMTEFLNNVESERRASGSPVGEEGGCFVLSTGSVCCSNN